MVSHKEKISLTEEQETLLVPLYCKAVEGQRAHPILVDEKSQEIIELIDYDFSQLKIPYGTRVTLCLRAKKLDAYAREFIAAHPGSLVLHLGCGLDSRYSRVKNKDVEWYDLDMPAVIDLRKKFFQETDTYHMIPSSVTDFNWMTAISPPARPVLVIAEGLLMYLREEEVKALILKLREVFPGCRLAFDAYSVLTARRVKAHPSIKKTGATVQWGIDDASAIEAWGAGIRLQEEWYFTQAEDISKLGPGIRLMFKLAGLFAAARRAHRVLYYTL
ncbi:MAG: class I SAM-dependent methyltransferase [Desulfatiglandales bacterium]